MRRASLQVKFGLSYILVIAAVLVFMNTYPLIVSENLVVRSKQTTLQSSVSVMVTALSGLEELSEENVASAMTLVEDTGISRILVTNAAGRILYDTRETDGAVGRYRLYPAIVQRCGATTPSMPTLPTARSAAARPRRSSTAARPSARSMPMSTTWSRRRCC